MTINDLLNIRQREGETLKQYMARIRATAVKDEDTMPDVCVGASKNGLRHKLRSNEGKSPQAMKQSRQAPYQSRGTCDYFRPWEQQYNASRREEASLVLNTT